MDRYDRQQKLRKAGYQVLRMWGPSLTRGFDGSGAAKEPRLIFDDREALERHCRNVHYSDQRRGSPWEDCLGYFMDDFQDNTARMVIAQYGRGWIHGYEQGKGCCISMSLPSDITKEMAVRYADRETEIMAEKEREYQAKWQRGREVEDKIEAAEKSRATHYREAKAWISGLRKSQLQDTLCNKIRATVADHWTAAREKTREILTLREELKTLPE